MEIHIEKLSPVLLEMQIRLPAEKVTAEVTTAFDNLRRTARVRGFRKGKAPVKILRQMYGKAVHADVAQRLVDSSLQAALKDKELQPLTQPDVAPVELKPTEPFSFRARFEVRPEVDQVEWKGLVATRGAVEVSDEELKAEIEALRIDHADMRPVEDRGARDGDFVQLKIHFDHGDHGHDEDHEVEVGSGRLLPFLEEALGGAKPGDVKKLTHAFPADHPNQHLRGAEVEFVLTIEEVKERVLPEVDDELAKDLEHADLAALEAALRDKIKARHEQKAEEELARQLVAELCAKNPIPVPPSLVEQQRRMTERELEAMARVTGQRTRMTADELRADSEMKVRAGLLMAEIAKEAAIKITQDDIDKGYEELAAQSGKNVARVKAEYAEQSKREMLIGMILEDKVLDLMEKNAQITGAS